MVTHALQLSAGRFDAVIECLGMMVMLTYRCPVCNSVSVFFIRKQTGKFLFTISVLQVEDRNNLSLNTKNRAKRHVIWSQLQILWNCQTFFIVTHNGCAAVVFPMVTSLHSVWSFWHFSFFNIFQLSEKHYALWITFVDWKKGNPHGSVTSPNSHHH